MMEKTHSITFLQADLMQPLASKYHAYCDSLSCLHALEHFGLGRYGDLIDFEGHKKGLENLALMLSPGGTLYLSVPIGKECICFNAHRIFNPIKLMEELSSSFELEKFSYVDDEGSLIEDFDFESAPQDHFSQMKYSCGIFQLVKN